MLWYGRTYGAGGPAVRVGVGGPMVRVDLWCGWTCGAGGPVSVWVELSPYRDGRSTPVWVSVMGWVEW